MSKILILSLCLLTFKNACSLYCFKTNSTVSIEDNSVLYGVVRRGEVSVRLSVENCDAIEGPKQDYSCYKVFFLDTTTDKAGLIKGCFPNKGCDWMRDFVKEQIDLPENDIECDQCDEDKCNAGARLGSTILYIVALFSMYTIA